MVNLYKKCKCSQTTLQHLIHIYWYVIFILDLFVFFDFLNINHHYLLLIGNLIGLINIYMTYNYMNELNNCKCSESYIKYVIIIIYSITVILSILYVLIYMLSYLMNY